MDTARTSATAQERAQFTEMDEAIFDIIGRDSAAIVDLKAVRELWEQDDAQESAETATIRSAGEISPDDLRKGNCL